MLIKGRVLVSFLPFSFATFMMITLPRYFQFCPCFLFKQLFHLCEKWFGVRGHKACFAWASIHVQVGIKGLLKGFSTLEDFDYLGAGNLKFSSISQIILELN